MKGVILTTFNDMVEQQVGMNVWEQVLDTVNPESKGIYTSVEDFPDEELIAMVSELSKQTGTPVLELIFAFGQYLFHALAMRHSVYLESQSDFLSFLKSIEDVIHREVEKLYPNPNLPTLHWQQPDENSLILNYQSPRKMCHLAVGLIRGAAQHYEVEYTLEHDPCMLDGASSCQFFIKLS